MQTPSEIKPDKGLPLVQALLAWYGRHKRDLPWRHTSDPYPIWLSEIIMQQTRVAQGLPYWLKFMEAYPTVHALAAAPDGDVMRLWQGLGYYSRARNLLKAARTVAENGWPDTYEGLLALPGVGAYTAAAIGSFAYGIPEPVVDGNVIRVISRLFKIEDDVTKPATVARIRALAKALIPHDHPAEFNQGMMEFGAIQCTPTNPACVVCPLQTWCEAFAAGLQNELPRKAPKADKRIRYLHFLALLDDRGQLAMRQRSGPGIWHSLFEPLLVETISPEEIPDFHNILPGVGLNIEPAGKAVHLLSHQRLEIRFYKALFQADAPVPEPYKFYNPEEVENLAKPIVIVKFVEQLYSSK